MERAQDYRIEIVTGQYQMATAEERAMLHQLFGAQAERDYEIYFHWHNLLHEIGHAIMMFHALQRPHPMHEEQLVNDFALAYWRHYGEDEKILMLSELVRRAVGRFTAPTAMDYMDYAVANWRNPAFYSFDQYGWFQFSCVEKSITQKRSLAQVLEQMGVCVQTQPERETLSYEINADMARRVVTDAARNLKTWGVLLPDEMQVVFCDDVNCHRMDAIKRSDA